MERRTYLATSVGLAGAIAGCSGIVGDSSSSDPSGPAGVAEAMIQAIIDGEIEEANGYRHPDSPDPPVGPANVESFQSANASVDRASVQSRNGDTATVAVVVRSEGESGEPHTVTLPFEMRKADEEWLVYEDLRASGPDLPRVQFEKEARTNDAGEVTAVAFTHVGGDDVEVVALQAQIGDAMAFRPEDDRTLQAGDTLVVPLDADGESYEELTRVLVNWSAQDSSRWQTLTYHQLSASTAGGLPDQFRVE